MFVGCVSPRMRSFWKRIGWADGATDGMGAKKGWRTERGVGLEKDGQKTLLLQ